MNFFKRLLNGLLKPNPAPPVPPDAASGSRLATLEMDLRERDELISRMKREYAALEAERERAASTAGQEHLEKVLRKVCGPLSNLATLAAAARAGKEVEAKDMAGLVATLERQLTALGLQPIGEAGAASSSDVALHQRMSGGAVHTGTPVTVQIPGYKLGDKVLQKAMVSAKE